MYKTLLFIFSLVVVCSPSVIETADYDDADKTLLQLATTSSQPHPQKMEQALFKLASSARSFQYARELVQLQSMLADSQFDHHLHNSSYSSSTINEIPQQSPPPVKQWKVNQLKMFASLSASAYCMASSLYPKWKCGKKRCSRPAITLRTLKPANDEPKFLLNSGFLGGDIGEDEDVLTRTRVLSLFSSRHTAMFGFVAENPLLDLLHLSERSDSQLVKKTILISFRGSLHPKNFVYDLHFAEIDYEYPDSQLQGARIHSGFWKTWQSVSEQIVTQVRSTISNHLLQSPQVGFKHFDIWISGHSLGGAVACICALELQKLVMNGRILPSEYYTNSNWQQPQLRNRVWYFDSLGISIAFQGFSFGEPRAGNAVFAEWVTRLEGLPFYRTTFYSDLVVHLPPKRFPVLPNMDFHHHASEYYIRKNQRDTLLCDHDDSNGNSGNVVTENPVCSGGVHFRSLLGHLTYFDIVFGPWC